MAKNYSKMLKKATVQNLHELIISCIKNAEALYYSAEAIFQSLKTAHCLNYYVISFEEISKALIVKELYEKKVEIENVELAILKQVQEDMLMPLIEKVAEHFVGGSAHENKIRLGIERFDDQRFFEHYMTRNIKKIMCFTCCFNIRTLGIVVRRY